MKALTIWQPWASLIIAGAKPYEFRGWRAPASIIGQRIVIHAAARKIDRAEVVPLFGILRDRDLSKQNRIDAAMTCLHPEKALPVLARAWSPGDEPLPMAAGIGTAVLGEPRLGTELAEEFGVPPEAGIANDSTRDEHANWGWPMLDIDPWPQPIPMRGKQGFWNWPTPSDIIGRTRMTTTIDPTALPEGEFAIVEALGHRTLVGRVAEIERFGTKMLQVEPFFGDVMLGPVLLGGGSIYQFTPVTADKAWSRRPHEKYQLPPSVLATVPATALPSNGELPGLHPSDAGEEDGGDGLTDEKIPF